MTTERVAMVVYLLMKHPGVKFTTADLAQRIGLTHGATWAMLGKASRAIPITCDIDGWYLIDSL